MFPRITNVTHVREYVLRLTFADGLTAEMDFRRRVLGRGGVFAPLEDVEFFSRARVDREVGA
ncbi:MAG: DUF2442 domain-containing protein, partial [Chloroflexi bacterium]|nr:DUF2442 domain-containing protein [Chloroflexota bacterium]